MTGKVQEGLGSAGLQPYFAMLERRPAWRWLGRIVKASGQTVESAGPLCSVGESCQILDGNGRRHAGGGDRILRRQRHFHAAERDPGHSVWRCRAGTGRDAVDCRGRADAGTHSERARRAARWQTGAACPGHVAARRGGPGSDGARTDSRCTADRCAGDRRFTERRDAASGWASLAARAWARAR